MYTFKEGITTMAEVSTSTITTPAVLDERVACVRAKLRSTPQGHQMLQNLSPVGMVQTDRHNVDFASCDVVDFTDWQQWSQWPQSY